MKSQRISNMQSIKENKEMDDENNELASIIS